MPTADRLVTVSNATDHDRDLRQLEKATIAARLANCFGYVSAPYRVRDTLHGKGVVHIL